MDRDLILVKEESIHRCLERIESKIPKTVDGLNSDIDVQDIILLNLERLIQQSVDLAEKLGGAVGFRNIAVHEYRKLDWEIVWAILREGPADFRRYTKNILALT